MKLTKREISPLWDRWKKKKKKFDRINECVNYQNEQKSVTKEMARAASHRPQSRLYRKNCGESILLEPKHFDAVEIAWNPFCLNRGAPTTMI